MKVISDSNLSKSDLEEVCRGLGIPTKETKADLIQRIRDFSNKGNYDITEQLENMKRVCEENDDELTCEYFDKEEDILEYDPQTQTLKELVQKSKGKSKISPPKPTSPNIKDQDPKITGETSESPRKSKKSKKRQFQDSCEHEGSETLEQKMLSAFKKLETAVLGFDDRLNSMMVQIQDTRQRHEYNMLRLVGRELDLAIESRNVQNADIAATLLDMQNDWLKGKDSHIKKAKEVEFIDLPSATMSFKLSPGGKCSARTMQKPTLDIPSNNSSFLNKLLEKVYEYIAPNSAYKKRLRNLWDEFVDFCKVHNLPSFPAHPKSIMSFLVWLQIAVTQFAVSQDSLGLHWNDSTASIY
ncbi:22014_t:CDS:2, partial [Dentiscutata erythropus]